MGSLLKRRLFHWWRMNVTKAGIPIPSPRALTALSSGEQKRPDEVFDALRALGGDDLEPIVQVNHPRSPILGYFTQYNVDPDNLLVKGETGLMAPNSEDRPQYAAANFSWNFDAIEVLNAKDYAFLSSYS